MMFILIPFKLNPNKRVKEEVLDFKASNLFIDINQEKMVNISFSSNGT